MATYYVDGVSGSDSNAGTSFGAAFATIGKAVSVVAAGDTIRLCATGTYTLTSTVSIAVGGTNGSPITLTGANATGTVDGTRATITSSTNSVNLFTVSGSRNNWTIKNINATHTAGTRGKFLLGSSSGTVLHQGWSIQNCTFDGFSNAINGDWTNVYAFVIYLNNVEIKNCTDAGIKNSGSVFGFNVYIHNCTAEGIVDGSSAAATPDLIVHLSYSVITTCSKCVSFPTARTIANLNTRMTFVNCVLRNSAGDNVFMGMTNSNENPALIAVNTINELAGGYGFNFSSAPVVLHIQGCAYRSNTSGNYNGVTAGADDVTLTGDPFTSSGSGDFTLNNTAGAGAACRATGTPGAFPGVSQTGKLDIGVFQHADPTPPVGVSKIVQNAGAY